MPTELDEAHVLRCLGCGYSLRGLEAERCPECGRGFDRTDPLTMDSPQRRERLRQRRLLSRIPILTWVATVAALWAWCVWYLRWGFDSRETIVAVTIGSATLARFAVRRRILAAKELDPQRRSERLANVSLYAFCVYMLILSGGVVRWSCPHGTQFGIGSVGIAFSTNGGPCRNRSCDLHSYHVRGSLYVWVDWRWPWP